MNSPELYDALKLNLAAGGYRLSIWQAGNDPKTRMFLRQVAGGYVVAEHYGPGVEPFSGKPGILMNVTVREFISCYRPVGLYRMPDYETVA